MGFYEQKFQSGKLQRVLFCVCKHKPGVLFCTNRNIWTFCNILENLEGVARAAFLINVTYVATLKIKSQQRIGESLEGLQSPTYRKFYNKAIIGYKPLQSTRRIHCCAQFSAF